MLIVEFLQVKKCPIRAFGQKFNGFLGLIVIY